MKLFKFLEVRRRNYDIAVNSIFGNLQKIPSACQEAEEPWLKCRYIVILLAFAAEFYLYAIRINMGVSIVAMVNNSTLPKEEGSKSYSCPKLMTNSSDLTEDFEEKDGEFLWSPVLQGYILGCSYVLYFFAIAPTGMLSELFGCKNALFWGFFFSTVFTFLSPFAAWCHPYLLIIFQSLRGLFQASFIPAVTGLLSKWCPKSERGFAYTFILSASCCGGVLGSYITGLLCKTSMLGGWPLGFFFFGGTGLILSLFMGIFMYENPSVHPTISQAELKYILDHQERILTSKRPKTPWSSLFTSVPVYALGYAYFGQYWAFCHFLSVHPTFLGTIIHYSIKENGLYSALPFLLQILTSVGSGCISTFLVSKNYLKVDTSRKFWTFLSCLGYSACLLGIYFAGCNRPVIVVLSIASLACVGFGYAGCFVVPLDMSPNFAGSLNVVASTLGATANFALPIIVGLLTNGKQTLEQWHKFFFISIGVVMSSGIIFTIFGSAEIQPWNDVQDSGRKKKKEEKEETRL